MNRWSRRAFLGAGLGLAGCATRTQPPLPWLYRPTRENLGQPPLIVIPGAFGSCLHDKVTDKDLWPGSGGHLLLSDYRALELQIDPSTLEPRSAGVAPREILQQGLGRDFYGELLDTLQRAGGYVRCGNCEKPRADRRNYYVYIYDFRLDNVRAAQGLHQLVERVRAEYGDPALRVDVVAHSNGGLVARYYARYGTAELPDSGSFAPTWAGADAIRRLLLIGTPNLGTLQPALSLLRGEEIGLRRIPPEVMATCQAPMQLLPHPAVPWIADVAGELLDLDLHDAATWREHGWGPFDPVVAERTVARHGGGRDGAAYLGLLREYFARQLARGRRFAESLAVPGSARDVRPHVFGGDCVPTLARLVLEQVDGRSRARERVRDIARPVAGVDYESVMNEPGDTVVTRSSLLGRRTLNVAAPRSAIESLKIEHSVFLCERHDSLTGNPSFQDNLLNALLNVDAA